MCTVEDLGVVEDCGWWLRTVWTFEDYGVVMDCSLYLWILAVGYEVGRVFEKLDSCLLSVVYCAPL